MEIPHIQAFMALTKLCAIYKVGKVYQMWGKFKKKMDERICQSFANIWVVNQLLRY